MAALAREEYWDSEQHVHADVKPKDRAAQHFPRSCSLLAGKSCLSVAPSSNSTTTLPMRFGPVSSPSTLMTLWSPRFSIKGVPILGQPTLGACDNPQPSRYYRGIEMVMQMPPSKQAIRIRPGPPDLTVSRVHGIVHEVKTKNHRQGTFLTVQFQSCHAETTPPSAPLIDMPRLVMNNAIGVSGLPLFPGILLTHQRFEEESQMITTHLDSASNRDSTFISDIFPGVFPTQGKDSLLMTKNRGIDRDSRGDHGSLTTSLTAYPSKRNAACSHRSQGTKSREGGDVPSCVSHASQSPVIRSSKMGADGSRIRDVPSTYSKGDLMETIATFNRSTINVAHTRRGNIESAMHSESGRIDNQDTAHVQWVVISSEEAEQKEQCVKKLRLEMGKNRLLEQTIKKYEKERLMIYDAAMRQATKREVEGVEAARRSFQEQHNNMRAEIEVELQKVDDLYERRCRDYAQMVSDEVEEETTKAVTDLRKDWARQKRTIEELIRDGGEDRQVTVIARAVMEQLEDERKNEIKTIREDIYAELKAEFDSRAANMRENLRNESLAELEGRLLLAEVQHQKEIQELKTKLSGGFVGPNRICLAANKDTCPTLSAEASASRSASPSSTRQANNIERIQDNVALDSTNEIIFERGKGCPLLRKLPTFKTPIQKPPHRSTITKTVGVRSLDDNGVPPKLPSLEKAKLYSLSPAGQSARSSVEGLDETFARDSEAGELDEGITSALVLSPTKSIRGGSSVRSSSSTLDSHRSSLSPTGESPRRKRKAKRLFSSTV